MTQAKPPGRADVRAHIDRLTAQGIDTVRVSYPDLRSTDRGRDILVGHLEAACARGLTFSRAIYRATSEGAVVDVPGDSLAGWPDMHVHPDLDTLVPLPWEPGVAWCLGDPREPVEGGAPLPESPREVLRRVIAPDARAGVRTVVGPEFEYFLLDPAPETPGGWRRYGGARGNVYSSGRRGDPDCHLLTTMRHLHHMGLGVTAGNQEADEGQFEINLHHDEALRSADRAYLFKVAVRELARKEGRLATFMAKPFNDGGTSGFHLHVSCTDAAGRNLFDDPQGPYGLSAGARYAVTGLLRHAPALTALLNPTVNSYRRLGQDPTAPRAADWGLDRRDAMIRVPPSRGDASRLELRLGDASANPYLAIAGLVAALRLGIEAEEEPPPPGQASDPDANTFLPLPRDLAAALDALEADSELTDLLGKKFTGIYIASKRHEYQKFQEHVTDWEFAEYSERA
ncbi:glutamine synthetase family protein [Streptomyces sp. NPDC003027]